jgi:integrase
MDYCQKFSKATLWEKEYTFKIFFQSFDPQEPVESLTPGVVLEFLQKIASKKGGNVANKIRKNLVAAWNWGIKYQNLPRPNPCLVERFAEKRKGRYVPPVEDFWKTYDAAAPHDQKMMLAYLHTAARRKELFELTWEDVDFANQRIRLWTSKRQGGTNEYDWIPMTDDLYNVLKQHRKTSKSDFVFPNPETGEKYTCRQHYLKRVCKRAGVPAFGWHAIRHLTASILISNGVPLTTIQKILRHKNLTTTQRYVHELDYDRVKIQQVLSRKEKSPQVA